MFEKCFKTTDQSTFKKENFKDEKVCRMWLGRRNEVARTPHPHTVHICFLSSCIFYCLQLHIYNIISQAIFYTYVYYIQYINNYYSDGPTMISSCATVYSVIQRKCRNLISLFALFLVVHPPSLIPPNTQSQITSLTCVLPVALKIQLLNLSCVIFGSKTQGFVSFFDFWGERPFKV